MSAWCRRAALAIGTAFCRSSHHCADEPSRPARIEHISPPPRKTRRKVHVPNQWGLIAAARLGWIVVARCAFIGDRPRCSVAPVRNGVLVPRMDDDVSRVPRRCRTGRHTEGDQQAYGQKGTHRICSNEPAAGRTVLAQPEPFQRAAGEDVNCPPSICAVRNLQTPLK